MNDPQRLVNSEASPFEARLLRAGARDGMSEASRRAIMSGVGVSGVVSLGVLGAVARRATRGLGLPSEALRWAGGAVLSAFALGAGVELWSSPSQHASFTASTSLQAPAERREQAVADTEARVEEAPKEEPVPQPDSNNRAPARPRVVHVGDKSDSLADELAAIELARGTLVRNNPAQCLRLLDDYTRRFPKRRLDAEATVLRIEALSANGDRAGALHLGKAFLAKQPQGPYARRVRSLIGEPRGPSDP